jgi:osmotically-inducible protein OsmY
MKDLGWSLVVVAFGVALSGCVAAVVGNAPHSGTAADQRARPPGDADAALGSAVSERVGANAALRSARVLVSAQGGIVTLRGSVGSEALRSEAARAARSVAGVIAVNNLLQVN